MEMESRSRRSSSRCRGIRVAVATAAAARERISPIHTEVARAGNLTSPIHTMLACAGTFECSHDNISIVTPQICDRGYYYMECRDCGATRKYAPSGTKTRAETIAEIQAMLKTEREQSV